MHGSAELSAAWAMLLIQWPTRSKTKSGRGNGSPMPREKPRGILRRDAPQDDESGGILRSVSRPKIAKGAIFGTAKSSGHSAQDDGFLGCALLPFLCNRHAVKKSQPSRDDESSRYMGTRVVSKISPRIASACSDFFRVETYRELTTTRWAKTGTIKRLKSSGRQ